MRQVLTGKQTGPAPSATEADVIDLTVVIVNYNVREFLSQALRSVERASSGLSVEVFVVDNNSIDGSVELVRQQFPWVRVLANDANVGFSRANNQALRLARGRYVLILNPDTILQEDTLSTMVRLMDARPELGAVGCKILNPDGTFAPESRRAFPRPTVAFYRIVGLSRLFPRSPRFARYNMTYLPEDEPSEVDALSGSCMLVRRASIYYGREAWERARDDAGADLPADLCPEEHGGAGLFDEDFFMYGEDLDWCYRIQQAGWKIYYTPETQIIHYKGESTKKGELRYVRLFYGAMLRFTEKHFSSRYSRLFAHLLRAGIFVRAALTVCGQALRRVSNPLVEFAAVYAAVLVLGVTYSFARGNDPSALWFVAVAPSYAAATLLGTWMAGGYRRSRRGRTGPAWAGAFMGLLVVAAASFFFKEIGFSRGLVLAAAPLVGLLLTARRLAARRGMADGGRQAVLVGTRAEAQRLHGMIEQHLRPPFELAGYVDATVRPTTVRRRGPTAPPARLGSLNQLRDIVRLRQVDDVIFAARGLSNRAIVRLMQELQDLPVQFRILADGQPHVIGKASVDDFSNVTLLEAEEALGRIRTPLARRAFEIPLAVLGLLLHPLVRLLAAAAKNPFYARLAERTRQMPEVLAGRRRLVGLDPAAPVPLPDRTGLEPGVFTLSETLATNDPEAVGKAYALYAGRQCASLDWEILLRAIATLRTHAGPALPSPHPRQEPPAVDRSGRRLL